MGPLSALPFPRNPDGDFKNVECVGETGWCVLRATQGGNQLAMR